MLIESISAGLILGSCVSLFKSKSSLSLSSQLLSVMEQSGIYAAVRTDTGKEVRLLPRINKEIRYSWGTRLLVNLPVGKSTADVFEAKQALSEALRRDIDIRFDDGTIIDVFDAKLTKLAPYRYEQRQDWRVPIAVNQRGETLFFDLDAPYPNLLVGGLPGSGKSVIVRVILTSLIKSYTDRVELFLVDLKAGVELSLFRDYAPVKSFATSLKEAYTAISEVERIMEERYTLMVRKGIRKWAGGRVVLVWDELSDLIADDSDKEKRLKAEIKAKLRVIAAKGRAAGVWLLLSTQRPTVNVISGDIRTNVSTTIALRCRDEIQSRTLLDAPDAAHIEATPGRAVFQQGHRQETVQLLYLDDSEAERLLADVLRREATQHGDHQSEYSGVPTGTVEKRWYVPTHGSEVIIADVGKSHKKPGERKTVDRAVTFL